MVPRARKPHSVAAKRCSVRYGTVVPDRGQQHLDLHDRQPVLHPSGDVRLACCQQLPRRPMAVRPDRADVIDHRTQQFVGQRSHPRLTGQAGGLRRLDVSSGRLAVHASPLGGRPQPATIEPPAQHLSNFNHVDLPERHRQRPPRLKTGQGDRTSAPDRSASGHAGWSHNWQNSGPISLAENLPGWSHHDGERHRLLDTMAHEYRHVWQEHDHERRRQLPG